MNFGAGIIFLVRVKIVGKIYENSEVVKDWNYFNITLRLFLEIQLW